MHTVGNGNSLIWRIANILRYSVDTRAINAQETTNYGITLLAAAAISFLVTSANRDGTFLSFGGTVTSEIYFRVCTRVIARQEIFPFCSSYHGMARQNE